MERTFKISGVWSDKAEEQVVVLKDAETNETFSIWVGPAEGDAIRFELDHVQPSRPMSHDLIRNLLDQFGVKVKKIVIHDIKNATYFAQIFLETKAAEELVIDARPSDAIALALRTHSPIYVTEDVLKKRTRDNIEGLLERFKTPESGGQGQSVDI